MSNEALTFVEIDIDVCSLTYGVAPCTANIPGTGVDKCFNSSFTCQDIANINLETVTLRFAAPATYLPRDIDILGPLIAGVDYSPSIVSLGENLGQRASIKVTFVDQPHSDAGAGLDKYHAERSYNPYDQGTLWGKFRARHPFLRAHALRWISGFVGQALGEMETRHFFVESINGPTTDGRFTITAKDALKFLDGDRAQAPLLSNGFLSAGITISTTSAALSPTGIGNAEYPASGAACIGGNEIISFTRSGDALTIVRAQSGSTASAHNAQDRVQLCESYTALDPAQIINNLIQNFTDTPPGYNDFIGWVEETSLYFGFLLTAVIAEPTPVNKLVSEIIEQCGGAMWDDNVGQKIRMQILRGIVTDADRFLETNVMQPAVLQVTDQPDKRVSQVWVYFGQIDPTKGVEDPDNYRSIARCPSEAEIDEAEEDYGSPAIRKIFARWIPAAGRTIAERLGAIIFSRYRDPPRKFALDVMRRSVTTPVLGGGYRLEWHNLQDAFGAREDVPIQVTRLTPGPAVIRVEAEEMRFTAPTADLAARQIFIDSSVNNFNLQAAHDSIYPALGGGDTVTCTIAADAIVGSTSTALPAFDVGTWSGSPTLNIINLGRIQGKGADGAQGGVTNTGASAGASGGAGGVALFTREAVTVTNTSGEIWSGGGGGGGGGRGGAIPDEGPPVAQTGGGGGGGGAGSGPGDGGLGGNPDGGVGIAGTTEAGGAAGAGPAGAGDGGAGGGPGLAGSAGQAGTLSSAGSGGAQAAAIDGVSFVSFSGTGDIRGSQIN